MIPKSRFLSLFTLCVSLVLPVFSQDPRGTIGGRVVDAQGATIVGARVTATNQETTVATSVVTNDAGAFRLLFLLPGKYKVTAEMKGFRTMVQSDLELRVADTLDLTLRMEVGNVAETIEVKGGTPLLDTADSSAGRSH